MKNILLSAVFVAGFCTFANAQSNTTTTQTPATEQAPQQRPLISVEELKNWEIKLKEGDKIKLHPKRFESFTPEAREYVLANPDKYEIMKEGN